MGTVFNVCVIEGALDANWANVTALLPLDGANTSTLFPDATDLNTWTVGGAAQISTAQSKFNGSSLSCNGTTSYLRASGANFQFDADFTVEFWWRPTSVSEGASRCMFSCATADASTTGFSLYHFNAACAVRSNGDKITHQTTLAAGTWYHMACTRQGSTVRFFLNGVKATSDWTTSANFSDGVGTIGATSQTTPTWYFNGYIDDVRVTKGVARYTATFTPPTYPSGGNDSNVSATDTLDVGTNWSVSVEDGIGSGDRYIQYVTTLLHFEGTNGSQSTTDLIPKGWTFSGNAQISNAQAKFGSTSCYFDGTGDYLYCPNGPDFKFSGDFTVEGWIRSNTSDAASHVIFDNRASAGSATGLAIYQYASGLNLWSNNALQISIVGLTAGVWHHFALTRSGTTVRLFLNGAKAVSDWTSSANFSDGYANIGRNRPNSNEYFNGYIDEFRITVGYARYTATFNPPLEAFPDAAPTTGGMVDTIDAAGASYYVSVAETAGDVMAVSYLDFIGRPGSTTIQDRVSGRSWSANSGAAIDSTQKKYGDTALIVPSGGYLQHANHADFQFGNSDFTIEFWYYPTGNPLGGPDAMLVTKEDLNITPSNREWYINWVWVSGAWNNFGFLWRTGPGVSTDDFAACYGSLAGVTNNNWYHTAVVREGSVVRLYLDGVLKASAAIRQAILSTTQVVRIGIDAGNFRPSRGYIDDVRITKGLARYSSNFTPVKGQYGSFEEVLDANQVLSGTIAESVAATDTDGVGVDWRGGVDVQEDVTSADEQVSGVGNFLYWEHHVESAVASDVYVGIRQHNVTIAESVAAASASAASGLFASAVANTGFTTKRVASRANVFAQAYGGFQPTEMSTWARYSAATDEGRIRIRAGGHLGVPLLPPQRGVVETWARGIVTAAGNEKLTFTDPPSYRKTISGVCYQEGIPVRRLVRLYRRSDGMWCDEQYSDRTTGAFTFSFLRNQEYFVIAFDDITGLPDYNAIVWDRVVPG